MGISISFVNDTNREFNVKLKLRGSGITVGSSTVKPGQTWTKTDNGIAASVTYNALLEDITSPLVFTGTKYETPKWWVQATAPKMKGEKQYKISELTQSAPQGQSRLSLETSHRSVPTKEGENDDDKDEEDGKQQIREAKHDRSADQAIVKTTEFALLEQRLMKELKVEDQYWNGQEMGLGALVNRAASGEDTFKGLSQALKGDIETEQRRAKTVPLATELGTGECGSVGETCAEFGRLRAMDAKAALDFANLKLAVIKKKFDEKASSLNRLKISAFAGVKRMIDKIKNDREKCMTEFTEYRKLKEAWDGEQNKLKNAVGTRDAYACLREYQSTVQAMKNGQNNYPHMIVQAAKDIEDADIKRNKELQEGLLEVLQAERSYLLQRLQRNETMTKSVEAVIPEQDYKLFGDELVSYCQIVKGDDSKVKEITFEPKPFGMSFRNRIVIDVVQGSQAEAKGVCPGWHILRIADKRSPPDHKSIQEVITLLIQANSRRNVPITITFGKKLDGGEPFFRLPPPDRDDQIVSLLLENELVYSASIEYLQAGCISNAWTKCKGFVTKTGNLHMYQDNETKTFVVSIDLKQSTAEAGEEKTFVLNEKQFGLFGSKIVVHQLKSPECANWVAHTSPFLSESLALKN
mmetsp:Transcript_15571/g.38408  ORF Transcript_15571/g.38408 Transcript_15571/m.38408 type:complete len:637 (-) Transcript_15571:309-2219(-)